MKVVSKIILMALVVLLVLLPLVACGGAPEEPSTPAETPAEPTEPTTTPEEGNRSPAISSLTAEPAAVSRGGYSRLACIASDPDGDKLSYSWSASGGSLREDSSLATWTSPDIEGEYRITITVSDDKGGTATETVNIAVLANQRPVISDLTADPSEVTPGSVVTLTCTATDADGDSLVYVWSADDEGTITGSGNVITWKLPDEDGKYVISVLDDGKGGTVRNETTVTVATPEMGVVLEPITSESASLSFAGDMYDAIWVGDNSGNKGVRAFLSYDISALSGATIEEAKLTFTTREIVGNPWGISVFLYVEKVEYGSRPLQATDFDIEGILLGEKFTNEVPEEIDVTLAVRKLLKPPADPRFQVRIYLSNYSNGNNQADYIDFSKAILTVDYTR